jgi:Transglutaminase-like superfamily
VLTLARCVHAMALGALTIEAWAGLVFFDVSRLAGFAGIHRYIRRVRHSDRSGTNSPESIVWAVDEACVWYFKRAVCLQRSFVATWMLRRHGFAASLVIGYRAVPFESHAWVEIDGRVVNDRPQYQKYFHVLERL